MISTDHDVLRCFAFAVENRGKLICPINDNASHWSKSYPGIFFPIVSMKVKSDYGILH